MYGNNELVWKPLLGSGGILNGLVLSSKFAQLCVDRKMTPEEQNILHDCLWLRSKPEDWHGRYAPSEVFDFYEDTSLLQAVYKRHDASSGKWLDVNRMKLGRLDGDMALTYSYHHARGHDMQDNLWLQFAFDQWAKYMVVIFEDE